MSNYKVNYLSSDRESELVDDYSRAWANFEPQLLQESDIVEKELTRKVESIICYSVRYFYLFVKVDQDRDLVNRDRAYQNGDGFHFALVMPEEDGSPGDEFYVIGISPADEGFQRKFVWYHNIACVFNGLPETTVDYIQKEGNTYFMVQIPFEELTPLKPFLNRDYGFNIRYCQAVPDDINTYMLKEDRIGAEQVKRKYEVYDFQKPTPGQQTEWSMDLSSLHCSHGQSLELKLGANGPGSGAEYLVKVMLEEELILEEELEVKPGLNQWSLPLNVDRYGAGSYELKVQLNSSDNKLTEKFELIIYDPEEIKAIKSSIDELWEQGEIIQEMKASISTLELQYQELEKALEEIKPYQSFALVNKQLGSLAADLAWIESGKSLFITGETCRMGLRSELDDTLQPYSIYIPESLEGEEEAGLLVLLHGSASDDRHSIHENEIKIAEENKLIIAAPFGRGESHAYAPKEALDDIIEVTYKVMDIFDIDEEKILIGGFSMGGYGTLRIYDYRPDLFTGVIVLSGHYNLLGMYMSEEQKEEMFGDFPVPDYSQRENIKRFEDTPMIFFHGKEDNNCSYQDMSQFFEKLKQINPDVVIHVAEDRGHSGLKDDWREDLQKWLNEILKRGIL